MISLNSLTNDEIKRNGATQIEREIDTFDSKIAILIDFIKFYFKNLILLN